MQEKLKSRCDTKNMALEAQRILDGDDESTLLFPPSWLSSLLPVSYTSKFITFIVPGVSSDHCCI